MSRGHAGPDENEPRAVARGTGATDFGLDAASPLRSRRPHFGDLRLVPRQCAEIKTGDGHSASRYRALPGVPWWRRHHRQGRFRLPDVSSLSHSYPRSMAADRALFQAAGAMSHGPSSFTLSLLVMACTVITGAQAQDAQPDTPNSGCTQDASGPLRRRPGQPVIERAQIPVDCDPNRLPTPDMSAIPAPQTQDRWRIVDQLGYPDNLANPYATNNPLKGDRPILGGRWFFAGTATSNTLIESRRVPNAAGANAPFLDPRQQLFTSQTASFDTVLYRGDTIFQPPDLQVRFTPIFNYSATRTNGERASTNTFGAQALFVETHVRDVSAHYDFDSLRVGIQPVDSDFRGFVFADQPLGVRVFGTRDNDTYQYNVGWFRPLPKNAARQPEFGAGLPENDILLANLYVQDLFQPGLTSEFLIMYDRSHARGTQIVPGQASGSVATFNGHADHNYDVTYLGYSIDGHLGRYNLTASLYELLGLEEQSMFAVHNARVQATFAAAEVSRDFDWIRLRASGLYASGDSDPLDRTAHGFDGISQSALFAGADSSFFIHQQLPLILNQISLKVRDSLFPDLRATASPGQSNYDNPGLRLIGLGGALDLTPTVRLSLD